MTSNKYIGGGTRWTAGRKAELVQAVAAGMLTVRQVCTRYGVSEEEFAQWQALYALDGKRALRVTQAQRYREHPRPKRRYRRNGP